MAVAYVGLGSNLGDRRATLEGAVAALGGAPGVCVLRVSSFHETEPVGGPPQPRYVNAVAEVETELGPRALLETLLGVEARFGRTRRERWGPRTLDLDLLLHGNRVVDEPGLVVPHPRMHERAFVLAPLCELVPEGRHPAMGRTWSDLLAALTTGAMP
jgi:2-amino-4-hydroxy-6-hydroxymethyldihydropteridine diphosphokinase